MVPSNTTPMNTDGPITLGASTATNKIYSGASHIPGSPNGGVDLSGARRYGIVAYWTGGTSAGNLVLQVSNDNVNFATLTGSTVAVSAGVAGAFAWEGDASFKFVRIVWTADTSGDTVLTSILHRQNHN